MSETYHIHLDSVDAVPDLVPDQGWIGMTVQFLVGNANAGEHHSLWPSTFRTRDLRAPMAQT